jgi:hypothetical protein
MNGERNLPGYFGRIIFLVSTVFSARDRQKRTPLERWEASMV